MASGSAGSWGGWQLLTLPAGVGSADTASPYPFSFPVLPSPAAIAASPFGATSLPKSRHQELRTFIAGEPAPQGCGAPPALLDVPRWEGHSRETELLQD